MPRYALDVRFVGSNYSGWQMQNNAKTIQGELDHCLQKLLRQPIMSYGAGRTDAGVHALQLPAHFDFEGELHPAFFKSINSILPRRIGVTRLYRCIDPDFHARFHATERAYRYQIIFQKDPMLHQMALWFKEDLDLEAMQRGAEIFKEYDSFESFCKSNSNNKTFFCDIRESYFEWEGNMLVYHVRADRFLRGMVRAIVGTLLEMGKGKISEDDLRGILEAKDRTKAGMSVQAHGLYLSEVHYPPGRLELIEGLPE